jgi:hypothetical protein
MIGRPSNSSRTQPLPTVERKQYTIPGSVARSCDVPRGGVGLRDTDALWIDGG